MPNLEACQKDVVCVLAVLVIFLREGVEASIIVAILLAYLNRMGLRKHFRDVFIGVGAALILATAGGVAAYVTIRTYDGSSVQTVFETITYLVAATALTYMTFWMRKHARGLSGELQAKAEAAMSKGARTGLAVLAFQAVGREGLETVVFTLAIAFSTTGQATLIGASIGLVIALGIAFAIYKLGHRLNLGRFFSIVGALLIFFAAGLLADAVQNMQELRWISFGSKALWNTSGFLSEDGTVGDIAHTFFGYAQSPTILQLALYLGYLAVVLILFLRRRGSASTPTPQVPAATA